MVALCKTKVEYHALANTTTELLYLRWLLKDMDLYIQMLLPYIATIGVPFRLLITMFFMSTPNTLKMTVTLLVNIFHMGCTTIVYLFC